MDILLFFAGLGIPIVTIGFFFVLFTRVFSISQSRRWFWGGVIIPVYLLLVIYLSQFMIPSGLKGGIQSFIEHAINVGNSWVLFLVLYGLLFLAVIPFLVLLLCSSKGSEYKVSGYSLLLLASFLLVAYIPDSQLRIALGSYIIILIFAGIEEIAKYSMSHYMSRNNTNDIAAIGVYIALSFALLETIVYAGASWHHGASIGMIALLLLLRSIISVSIHVISTQIALGILTRHSVTLSLSAAILFHSVINLLLASENADSLYYIAPILLISGSGVSFFLAKKYGLIGQ